MIRSLLGGMPHQGSIRYRFQGSAVIGYVPQLLEFDHSIPMNVADFMSLMLQRRAIPLTRPRKRSQEIRRLLARTGCEHLEQRRMGSVSGGEFQRVLLAQALYPEPELLILDEPSSNVDEAGRRRFESLLRQLCDNQGVTVVMVGHHLAAMLEAADQVAVLNRRLIVSGPANTVARSQAFEQVFGLGSPQGVEEPTPRRIRPRKTA